MTLTRCPCVSSRAPSVCTSSILSPSRFRIPSSLLGRVEDERGGVQDRRRLLRAASFVVALAEKSIAPFLVPAHRTGRDHFGHPALGRVSRAAFADPAWPSRIAPVGASGVLRGLLGSRQSPSPRLVRARPEPGPLPSTGVTQLPRYYGPLRRLPRPAPRERVPSRPGSATGLPCCQSPRAYVLRPLPRRAERSSGVGVSDRPRRPSSIERRLGARIQPFGACSGFTRVAARTLADPPKADLCPRGFDGPVALAVSQVATKVHRHLLGPDLQRLR